MEMVHAAKAAKVPNFVFISAHDYQLPFVLSGYVRGKKKAEAAVRTHFPQTGTCLRPAFIYGTRQVNKVPVDLRAVGEPLEAILRSRQVADLGKQLPMLAPLLAPPVNVKDVAAAAAYAAVAPGVNVPVGMIEDADISRIAEKLRR